MKQNILELHFISLLIYMDYGLSLTLMFVHWPLVSAMELLEEQERSESFRNT